MKSVKDESRPSRIECDMVTCQERGNFDRCYFDKNYFEKCKNYDTNNERKFLNQIPKDMAR